MPQNAVLIVTSSPTGSRFIANEVANLGYIPLVRETVERALQGVRAERVRAVVVDVCSGTPRSEIDPLEFVLNLRDLEAHLDRTVPTQVYVLPDVETPIENEIMKAQRNVSLVSDRSLLRKRLTAEVP